MIIKLIVWPFLTALLLIAWACVAVLGFLACVVKPELMKEKLKKIVEAAK